MTLFFRPLLAMSALALLGAALAPPTDNTLSTTEKREGWKLLFNGKDTSQWRGAYQEHFPAKGWKIESGELKGEFTSGMEAQDGGDIVTQEVYSSFEMLFDWKLGPGGNSGVKYFIEERQPKPEGSQPGYEYQIIDDADYIYKGSKLTPRLKTAAIYDVVPADKPDVKMGVWHRSRIRVQRNHIQHWLDGALVLDVERTSDRFKEGVATSKFANYPGFASIPRGHILLQDHGHNVEFKNLKVRRLAESVESTT